MKFDFHCHSNESDGLLTPLELVDYAIERQVELLALTDHDSVEGLAMISDYLSKRDSSKNLPIKLVNGVEISALTEFGEIHIVGLDINPQCAELKKALQRQVDQRWQRATDIDLKLAKLGVVGVLEQTKKNVKQVITRSHIAKAIVELGFAKDMQQAFKRYIGKQGKIKVAKDWMPMAQAIELIHNSGGVSVLAHPTRYPVSNRKLSLLIEAYKQQGGDAIELAYPSLNKDKLEWLMIQREKHQLLASSGSDFHYPNLRWTDLGRFPPLDSSIPHVLELIAK